MEPLGDQPRCNLCPSTPRRSPSSADDRQRDRRAHWRGGVTVGNAMPCAGPTMWMESPEVDSCHAREMAASLVVGGNDDEIRERVYAEMSLLRLISAGYAQGGRAP